VPRFLVLIYGDERQWAGAPPEWHAANAERHQALIASAGAAIIGVNELEPASRAISRRVGTNGEPSISDGPFLGAREVVGGYYVIEAVDRDDAIRLAGQIPEATAPHGGVEIRQIVAPG